MTLHEIQNTMLDNGFIVSYAEQMFEYTKYSIIEYYDIYINDGGPDIRMRLYAPFTVEHMRRVAQHVVDNAKHKKIKNANRVNERINKCISIAMRALNNPRIKGIFVYIDYTLYGKVIYNKKQLREFLSEVYSIYTPSKIKRDIRVRLLLSKTRYHIEIDYGEGLGHAGMVAIKSEREIEWI